MKRWNVAGSKYDLEFVFFRNWHLVVPADQVGSREPSCPRKRIQGLFYSGERISTAGLGILLLLLKLRKYCIIKVVFF